MSPATTPVVHPDASRRNVRDASRDVARANRDRKRQARALLSPPVRIVIRERPRMIVPGPTSILELRGRPTRQTANVMKRNRRLARKVSP